MCCNLHPVKVNFEIGTLLASQDEAPELQTASLLCTNSIIPFLPLLSSTVGIISTLQSMLCL